MNANSPRRWKRKGGKLFPPSTAAPLSVTACFGSGGKRTRACSKGICGTVCCEENSTPTTSSLSLKKKRQQTVEALTGREPCVAYGGATLICMECRDAMTSSIGHAEHIVGFKETVGNWFPPQLDCDDMGCQPNQPLLQCRTPHCSHYGLIYFDPTFDLELCHDPR